MRIANLRGRAVITAAEGGIDVESASGHRFSSDTDAAVRDLNGLRRWYDDVSPTLDPGLSMDALTADLTRLGPPITRPAQIFAIGLNYRSHADEAAMSVPKQPMIFTKFVSSIAGPAATVALPSDTVDWEVELVCVIGGGGRDIPLASALDRVAGFCVGQDISERTLQMANSPAQFSLAKSYPNFAPIGPWLTTLDELDDPENLGIECRIGDDAVQSARTNQMIFGIAFQISYLSAVCELYPGDVIFTGTPAGVGLGRTPPRYLRAGDELVSTIEGLGSLHNACVGQ